MSSLRDRFRPVSDVPEAESLMKFPPKKIDVISVCCSIYHMIIKKRNEKRMGCPRYLKIYGKTAANEDQVSVGIRLYRGLIS